MNFSEMLVSDFNMTCVQFTGGMLPLNSIHFDPEANTGYLSHVVPDGEDPVRCIDGTMVRQVSLTYSGDVARGVVT